MKAPYREYEALKAIPEVKSGSAAPWFGKPGRGHSINYQ
ncbi:TNT domain-containing protein [Pseudomonas capsici]|nr:TNT domain-containing protein [Pseudomonas capsici]MCV4344080.1 TNT domain-containing protein [Pseudomonas capsici]